ncbi:MAG: metallophosphoesterase [Lachnospiraceae bacterium]|nr:metallophosphoesterase [Lachnospiraceae bacterium]
MKIVHCADLHLSSGLLSNFDKAGAKQRNAELVATFLKMVEQAAEQEVSAVIIAGDLFDTKSVDAYTRNSVRDAITGHPSLDFYLLRGNHDTGSFLNTLSEPPANLHLFEKTWTSYEIPFANGKKAVIHGIELDRDNAATIYDSLDPDPDTFNIVTLHGQIGDYKSKYRAESISLGNLKNRNIDYLALGHIHEFRTGELAPRGTYCYPGCLEGRGFDESGEHGYVLLEVDEDTFKTRLNFVPIAKRLIYRLEVDVTGCMTTPEIEKKLRDAIAGTDAEEKDYMRLELVGRLDASCEKNLTALETDLKDGFFVFEIKDRTRIEVDYGVYREDISLKGEFVRMLEQDASLSEEEKTKIIRCGLQALAGEVIEP